MDELNGRVAVVTGGASGIGFGLASAFAAEGMKVVIGDIEEPALDDAVAKLEASGAEVLGVPTDVSDDASVAALAAAAVDRFGAIHIACNNAGVGAGGMSWDVPLDTWQWVLGVNMWGVIHGIRAFVPVVMRQPEGHIVNTASIAGLVAGPFMGPYNASKHAVVALSETLHHEMALLAPHVKVSVLCPGWVRTRIADSQRNRPTPQAPVSGTENTMLADILRARIDDAMPPEVLAAKVVDAIRAERFWILPHDDSGEGWAEFVNGRAEAFVERKNPELRSPL